MAAEVTRENPDLLLEKKESYKETIEVNIDPNVSPKRSFFRRASSKSPSKNKLNVSIEYSEESFADEEEEEAVDVDRDDAAAPTTTTTNDETPTLLLDLNDPPDQVSVDGSDNNNTTDKRDEPPASPFSSILSVEWLPTTTSPTPNVRMLDGDDLASVATNFDLDDFKSSDWDRVVSNSVGLGLVVVALATAVTHPVLFLAGAVTAVTTATAAQQVLCYPGGATVSDNNQEATMAEGDDEKPHDTSTDSGSSSDANTDTDLTDAALRVVEPIPSSSFTVPSDNILDYYPKLSHTVFQEGVLSNLNVTEFFEVFLADEAPYHFRVLQEKRGDTNIYYGRWKECSKNSIDESPLSFVKDAPPLTPQGAVRPERVRTRTLTFQAKTNNLFGPTYADTTKTQRFVLLHKKLGILESKTEISNVPYGDRFHVLERWVIEADVSRHHRQLHICASCQVVFQSPCPFEYQIKTKSASTLASVIQSWYTMAQSAMHITEQRRGSHDQDDDPEACVELVNVAGNAFVVGEKFPPPTPPKVPKKRGLRRTTSKLSLQGGNKRNGGVVVNATKCTI